MLGEFAFFLISNDNRDYQNNSISFKFILIGLCFSTFLQFQLYPAWEEMGSIFYVNFIPFGKSKVYFTLVRNRDPL